MRPADDGRTDGGCLRHGRLTALEAAVVITVICPVPTLSATHRPIPAVLLALGTAAALVLRTPVTRLLGRCPGGQG
ncbi:MULTISPECIES: hypothetical protein [unclassified Streptomyces]|uniref:hypothetical protein n=1 Tax=unclassified Streptomyces TaxID=2593676 RepID=UPI001488FF93|nr:MULTISPECIES: hypothetical protein [unclassified Streptomyces]